MKGIITLYNYIGPVFWALLPISIITLFLVLHVLHSSIRNKNINNRVKVILSYSKDTATLLGLLGSVYALTASFQANGNSAEEIRQRMFAVLSTGFWSTIAGVIVSLEASIGLLVKDLSSSNTERIKQ